MSREARCLRDEAGRVRALKRYAVLDTPPEDAFERITRIARAALGTPIAAVTLIDDDRQWYKSMSGLEATEIPRELAFCNQTIRENGPVIVADARRDRRFADNPMVTGDPGIRGYLATQLKSPDGYAVGTVCAVDLRPRAFRETHAAALDDLARVAIDELELRLVARTDEQTGAMTRRGVLTELDREIERSARYLEPLSVLALDIDRFSALNDRHGHDGGDAVLRTLGSSLSACLRSTDVIGRMGGDTFLILLPHTDLIAAESAAERFQGVVERAETRWNDANLSVSVSIGAAEFDPCRDSAASLVARAQAALRAAKDAGGSQNRKLWTDDQIRFLDARASPETCGVGRTAVRWRSR